MGNSIMHLTTPTDEIPVSDLTGTWEHARFFPKNCLELLDPEKKCQRKKIGFFKGKWAYDKL